MGRSIIRSKIFAKQNIPSTGGGGGSAISVYDDGTLLTSSATSFDFTGLNVTATNSGSAVTVNVNNYQAITSASLYAAMVSSQLVPARTYLITDSPLFGFNIYTVALAVNKLDPRAVIYTSSLRRLDGVYDVASNTVFKVYDNEFNNTIEGWANIQAYDSASGFSNNQWSDNHIDQNSVIYMNSATGASGGVATFSGNTVLNNSILDLRSASIEEVSNNTIINKSTLYLRDTYSNTTSGAKNYVKNNFISRSDVFLRGTGFLNINDNTIINSSSLQMESLAFSGLIDNTINDTFINAGAYPSGGGRIENTSHNILANSTLNLDPSTNIDTFERNHINNTTLTLGDPLGYSHTYNVINNSTIQNYNCSLNNCTIDGMGNLTTAITAFLDTGELYNGCNYRYMEDSTFYVSYDVDDVAIYDAGTERLSIPSGHEIWIGKITCYSSGGSGTVTIKDISNFPTTQKVNLFTGSSITKLRLVTTSGFFKFPASYTLPYDLQTVYDFLYLDGRPSPIGAAGGTEAVVLHSQLY